MTDGERINLELGQSDGAGNSSIALKQTAGLQSFPPNPARNDSINRDMDVNQWLLLPNHCYRQTSSTTPVLPAGAYSPKYDNNGSLYFEKRTLLSDRIITLPDSISSRAVDRARKFWQSKERYDRHGLLYKTGMLFFGPPGSGKTTYVQQIASELMQHNGVTLYCDHPQSMREALKSIRLIEKTRPLVIAMEDIDELIREYGESPILSVLDGEDRIDNVIFLATTNYIGKLGARIVNRPARFDERIYVGMPSFTARRAYLEFATTSSGIGIGVGNILEQWVKDTDGMSISHLRELVASVLCLEQPYVEVLERLKSMMDHPKEGSDEGFRMKKMGLSAV